MAIDLGGLLKQMSERGLGFRRTEAGIEVVGDCHRLTPDIRQAIRENQEGLLAILPPKASAGPAGTAGSQEVRQTESIRQALDELSAWLTIHGGWIEGEYAEDIEQRLQQAAESSNPAHVRRLVATIRDEIEAANWAGGAFPFGNEAGPADGEDLNEIPF